MERKLLISENSAKLKAAAWDNLFENCWKLEAFTFGNLSDIASYVYIYIYISIFTAYGQWYGVQTLIQCFMTFYCFLFNSFYI